MSPRTPSAPTFPWEVQDLATPPRAVGFTSPFSTPFTPHGHTPHGHTSAHHTRTHHPPTPGVPLPMQMSRPIQFEGIMSPLNLSHDPRFRRRGRQPTACTECNRRKQRCDGLQPCHHCAKRNVNELCRFPDQKPKPRPRGYSDHSEGSATARMSSSSASDDSDNPFKRKSSESDTRSPKRPAFFVEKLSSPLLNSPSEDPRSGPPPTRRPSLQDLVHHSIPVSSERQSAQTPTPPLWDGRGGSRPPQFRGTRTPDSWGSQHEDGVFMQENGALGYGSLAVEGHGDESGRKCHTGYADRRPPTPVLRHVALWPARRRRVLPGDERGSIRGQTDSRA